MTPKDSLAHIEARLDQLLNASLNLSDAEVDAIYRAERPDLDVRQRVLELAERAAEICKTEQRPRPPQLEEALAVLRQLPLQLELELKPLETPQPPRRPPCVLLIDDDPARLVWREKELRKGKIETRITTNLSQGLDWLETDTFQLVILDYRPSAEQEDLMGMIQRFNAKVPIFTVSCWARHMFSASGLLGKRNALTCLRRIVRQPPPSSTRVEKPPIVVSQEQPQLNFG